MRGPSKEERVLSGPSSQFRIFPKTQENHSTPLLRQKDWAMRCIEIAASDCCERQCEERLVHKGPATLFFLLPQKQFTQNQLRFEKRLSKPSYNMRTRQAMKNKSSVKKDTAGFQGAHDHRPAQGVPQVRGAQNREGRLRTPGVFLLEKAILFYQKFISPLFPPCCIYEPTCSQYALAAIRKYGAFLGAFLAIRRILRCHPLHKGGFDPVPEHFYVPILRREVQKKR